MGTQCLKCGYERTPADQAPDYECPQCGAIYAKVEKALNITEQQDQEKKIMAVKARSSREKRQRDHLESNRPRETRSGSLATIRKNIAKFATGLIGGLIPAFLGMVLVSIMSAASFDKVGWGAWAFLVFWGMGITVAISASTAAKAWRRLLLSSSILSFLMPISGIIYTGNFMAAHVDTTSEYAGAAAAGAAIGGGLVSGFMGFVGFFLGVVFLIVGLLVGRDKQVVYVEKAPQSE